MRFRDETSGDEVNIDALTFFWKHVRVPYGLEALVLCLEDVDESGQTLAIKSKLR